MSKAGLTLATGALLVAAFGCTLNVTAPNGLMPATVSATGSASPAAQATTAPSAAVTPMATTTATGAPTAQPPTPTPQVITNTVYVTPAPTPTPFTVPSAQYGPQTFTVTLSPGQIIYVNLSQVQSVSRSDASNSVAISMFDGSKSATPNPNNPGSVFYLDAGKASDNFPYPGEYFVKGYHAVGLSAGPGDGSTTSQPITLTFSTEPAPSPTPTATTTPTPSST